MEVGISGREGMIGMPLSGGIDEYTYKVVVQVPGTAFEVKASALQKLFPFLPGLYQLLVRALAIRKC